MSNDIPPLTDSKHPPGPLRRITIDPVTRVEGHGKVTLLLDEHNQVQQARLHIVEFRGFEKFIQGRPYWELPLLVQRLCGICPVSHHLAAAKAIDQIVGVDQISESAEKLRRLLHLGQTLQSHALHFFHLASPDLLFGFDSDILKRNIIGVIKDYPDIATHGVKIRKYGQEIIRVISGKRIHGIAAVPGGMNKALTAADIQYLKEPIADILQWTQQSLVLAKNLFFKNQPYHHDFATLESHYMSLVGEKGEWDIYHGGLRLKDKQGRIFVDHFDYQNYPSLIQEQVKSWTYMKFPFLTSQGTENGWYRVGPLARVNNADFFTTPLAEAERQEFAAYGENGVVHSTLAYHWARMIEVLHCAEAIDRLLNDPALTGTDLVRLGVKQKEGVGVIEAPRGTLFHHYRIDDDGLVEKANLIVSTTSNNHAMNESVKIVAHQYLSGKTITPELLNQIEVAIRAYDPCLSCATHAVGKMPLSIELIQEGNVVDRLVKHSDGRFSGDVAS